MRSDRGRDRSRQGDLMIIVTTLDGDRLGLNPDLIRHVEAGSATGSATSSATGADTVVVLVDGTRYVVSQTLDDVADQLLAYRVAVVAGSKSGDRPAEAAPPDQRRETGPELHLVP